MGEPEKKGPENREFVRVKAVLVTSFRVFCNLDDVKNAELQNLSAKGIMFSSQQSLPADQRLEIKLSVPVLKETLEFEGRVAWSERNEKKNAYNTGVAMTKISPENHERLVRLINYSLASDN